MPDRGLLEATDVEDVRFGAAGPFVLESARWLQITFEVAKEAALAALPPDAGRPIPPYARLLIADSPAGGMAALSVGSRYRMMPRNVLVEVIAGADFESARGSFGSGTRSGTVALRREGQRIEASVSDTAGPLATVILPDAYAIDPSMLRWDAMVALAREGGAPVIAELTPAPSITAAFLSKGATIEIARALPREHRWRALRSLGTISACYAEGTLNLGEPIVQQTWTAV